MNNQTKQIADTPVFSLLYPADYWLANWLEVFSDWQWTRDATGGRVESRFFIRPRGIYPDAWSVLVVECHPSNVCL